MIYCESEDKFTLPCFKICNNSENVYQIIQLLKPYNN